MQDFIVEVRIRVDDRRRGGQAADSEDCLGGAVDVGDEGHAGNRWTLAQDFGEDAAPAEVLHSLTGRAAGAALVS